MNKYIVCKKVFATELIWVEADSKEEAVNLVSEGDGVPARLEFEWDGDMPPHFWTAHEVEITGEDVQSLQEYTTALAFEE
jgi:hypothetical protein